MIKIPSPLATDVVPRAVSPSIKFSSVVVTEAPSKISSSASLIPALPIVTVPAKVTFAPLKVIAVVVPDLIIRSPLVFVALPKVVPSSLKKISPPPASRTMSVPASILARAEAEIVKSVPSPSIFSPSSPKVRPMFAGMLISPLDPTVIERSVPSDSSFSPVAKVSPTPLGMFTSAVAVRLILLPLIVKSVPSPSIFSPSLPKVTPTPEGIFTSAVAVRLISAPDVTVMSVLLPSIFSPVPKVIPTSAGTTTSAVAVRLMLLPLMVRSVPSPSIFSPSLPKVTPISVGILMSPPAPTVIDKSVPSDSIFSAVANVTPTPLGILTSAVAVRLMLLPLIVRSVPSPSIFSPSFPNVNPILAGIFISAPDTRCKSVPSP